MRFGSCKIHVTGNVHTEVQFNNTGIRGADTVENLCITLQLALCIWGSISADSTNCGWCSTVVCIYWKKLHVSGLMQFKSVLFKDQPYFQVQGATLLWFLSYCGTLQWNPSLYLKLNINYFLDRRLSKTKLFLNPSENQSRTFLD